MIFLNKRSNKKELLDAPHIPFADIAKNMEELDVINNKLGGHRITIKGIQSLIPETAEIVRIAEIGCGGGDNLRAIKNWASRNGRQIELLGIDHNEACIAYARNRPLNSGIRFEISDYRAYKFDKKPDIIFSSLFCHHFNEN
nr:methyltransferase domain-containing protein [Flavisolibacter sp.]